MLGNLRLRNIAMRGPWLFFPSQSFPAGVYKKRLHAWSSVILISSLLLARVPQMVFIFPGSRPVHLVFSLHFCVVVGHASDLFGSPMALSFSSNQRVLLFSSPPFFLPTFRFFSLLYPPCLLHLKNPPWFLLYCVLIFTFVNGREIRPLHLTAHRRTSGFKIKLVVRKPHHYFLMKHLNQEICNDEIFTI